jgi:tRNA 2-thiocytidine biosynthesis protein TtcA
MDDANRQAFFLLKKVNKAIRDYKMIADGDRIAVAVSGGNDSLSLLQLLKLRQNFIKERYELAAIHIIGDTRGPNDFQAHPPLVKWLAESGIEYAIEPMEIPENEPLPLPCHRCTWNRRKKLFLTAQRLGCCKVAFGHHADDIVETALLNLFYQGRMETMEPCASYFGGIFFLIRPLIYIYKRELTRFAQASNFPPPPPACPRQDTSRRKLMGDILRLAERDCQPLAEGSFPIRNNILKTALRTMRVKE